MKIVNKKVYMNLKQNTIRYITQNFTILLNIFIISITLSLAEIKYQINYI